LNLSKVPGEGRVLSKSISLVLSWDCSDDSNGQLLSNLFTKEVYAEICNFGGLNMREHTEK
jgi:hypothetical protein